jgi:hypothetical protein
MNLRVRIKSQEMEEEEEKETENISLGSIHPSILPPRSVMVRYHLISLDANKRRRKSYLDDGVDRLSRDE